MSRHDPRVTLRQIADYGRRVQQLCAGREMADLLADWQATLAFERALEIIGEAVKRLPPELCATRPEIPWREIASMQQPSQPRLRRARLLNPLGCRDS